MHFRVGGGLWLSEHKSPSLAQEPRLMMQAEAHLVAALEIQSEHNLLHLI